MITRLIRSIIFYLFLVIGYFIGSLAALLLALFSKDKSEQFRIVAKLWGRFLVFFSGIKVTVSGLENVPKDRAVILAANHQGAADILFVLAFMPITFRFAVKKELFKLPIFGWYLRHAGYFSIDRKVILSAYRTVEKIIEIIKFGGSVLIFPEGTRTRTGQLGKFKRGSLLAALKSGAPIVPIAISGSFHILPRGTGLIHNHPVKITVGKPIYITSEEDYDNKVTEVHNVIGGML